MSGRSNRPGWALPEAPEAGGASPAAVGTDQEEAEQVFQQVGAGQPGVGAAALGAALSAGSRRAFRHADPGGSGGGGEGGSGEGAGPARLGKSSCDTCPSWIPFRTGKVPQSIETGRLASPSSGQRPALRCSHAEAAGRETGGPERVGGRRRKGSER